MSLQEALSQGVSVTGIGLLIVFSVLIILMLVMNLMKKIFYKEPQKAIVTDAITYVEEAEDEDELIAVFAAAISASLNTSTYNLKIKSYRRTSNSVPTWSRAGVDETINSRL